MESFCPKCGDETEGYGPRGLCQGCYLEEKDLIEVPESIDVERCEHCGAVKIGMDWVEAADDREMIARVLEHEVDTEKVRAVSFTEKEDRYELDLMVEAEVEGETLRQELETVLEIERTQCGTCSKFHGGYYEYKIQMRGEDMEEALDAVMERAAEVTERDREEFVSNVEEKDGGYNVYVSSRDMAEELLKVLRERFEMEEKRSKELIGEEEGEKVYRSVVSARIGEQSG